MTRAGGEAPDTPALAALVGARVRRVDLPSADLVALSLALATETTVLLVSLDPRNVALGCVEARPRGAPARGFATFLRTHIEGSTLAGAEAKGTALVLRFTREPLEVLLAVEPTPNLVCIRDARILGAFSVPRLRERGLFPGGPWTPPETGRAVEGHSTLARMKEAGAALGERRSSKADETAATVFLRNARTERSKVARRLSAIEKDRARADETPRLRAEASAILASAARLGPAREDRTLELEGVSCVIPAGASPVAHATELFTRAKKLEAGAHIAEARAAEARLELERLDRALVLAESPDADLDVLARELGLRAAHTGAPGKTPQAQSSPYRTFLGHADRRILVGRSARDNDVLTTKIARPHDLWLHVRGSRGSHVVVPLERGESCPAELLVDAAHLAVRFSGLDGTTDADVAYVERRHVRKPRGSAPGAVTFERDKTLALRVEPERLTRLLARQEK